MISIFPPWQDSLIIFCAILLIVLLLYLGHWFLGARYFHKHHVGEKFYVVSSTKRKIKTSPIPLQEFLYEGIPQDVGHEEYFIPKGNKGQTLEYHVWYELVLENDVYKLVKANM